jgi:CubicO group peptidase (beta-lactamase class C family)
VLARLLVATLALLLLIAAPASADEARLEAARAEVARAIVAQIPGATLRSGDDGRIDGTFNVPAAQDLAAGRTQVMLDPAFWVAAVSNLLQSGSVTVPTPIDVVKPEAFLPTALVPDGPYVSALPRRDRDLSGVTYEWQGRKKTLREFLRTTETDVVAFVRDGEVIADLYENGWSADRHHQPWSATKTFIAATVGIAVAEGKIRSVQDPIEAYIPELAGTAWEGARIVDVLQMRSGVFWDEDDPVLARNTQVQQWIQAALDLVTEGQLGQGRNDFLRALPKETEPGTKWRYNSGATQVLAWLTEKVYGKPFNQVISEKLWQPAGMDGDARILTDRVGDAIASQGLYSRVFDLARFGELLRNGGRTPEGRQVVPAAWVRDMTTLLEAPKGAYGYQTWIGPMPGTFQASGFQGQKISVAPDHCLVGVRLSHAFGMDTRPGDKPAEDPASYGFGTEFHAKEWNAMYAAVAEHLGRCRRGASDPVRGAADGKVRLARTARLSRAAALRRGALRVRLGATGSERVVRVTALAGRVRVATRRLTVRPGAARSVRVPLTAKGRRLLRTERRVPIRVVVRAADTRELLAARRTLVG